MKILIMDILLIIYLLFILYKINSFYSQLRLFKANFLFRYLILVACILLFILIKVPPGDDPLGAMQPF